MSEDQKPGAQRIIPMLAYTNAGEALDFLCKAFGFEERFRMDMEDGRIGHAEVGYQENIVMIASAYPELGLQSPMDLPAHHSQIYCYVDDVDAHYEVARAAGATVATEPEDQGYGVRSYRAVDSEGHRWIFATPNDNADGQ